MKVGFIGLGNVGSKLAKNLINNNFSLCVLDLNTSLSSSYLKMGAVSLSSPAFKDEGGERYLVKDVLLGTGTPGLKSGFMYL